MPKSLQARAWSLIVVLYVAFFSWYTSFGGPLSAEEIARYTEVLRRVSASPERLAIWTRFMETDTGDDFAMLNAIELRDVPDQVPGVEPGETSSEVLSRYTTPFMASAMRNAAHPAMYGFAAGNAMDLWGIDGATEWTHGGLVRYRSRRDLMNQLVAISEMKDAKIHGFKIAAMEKTVAYPLDPWYQLGDPRFVLALVLAIAGLSIHVFALSRESR
jgi:hypothetical protein